MASGHVNRINRPNTWLHRPTCKREKRPCQLGAVHTWHLWDIAHRFSEVREACQSGHRANIAEGPNLTDTVEKVTRDYRRIMIPLCLRLSAREAGHDGSADGRAKPAVFFFLPLKEHSPQPLPCA